MVDTCRKMSSPRDPNRRVQLVDVVVALTAERGLDAVSIREVASAAGVSIGAVQHHFPTKDAMLEAAFEHVVTATRARVAAVSLVDGDVSGNLSRVLQQLLPLDAERRREARVSVAFAARAATAPALRRLQRRLLAEIRRELRDVLGAAPPEAAAVVLALVDGLALHEASSGISRPAELVAALEFGIAAVVGTSAAGPAKRRPRGPG